MNRICYACGEKVELNEAIKTQKLLDIVMMADCEYEGLVDCRGTAAQFVQETDTDLLKALEGGPASYIGSIHLHLECLVDNLITEKWSKDLVMV